MTKKKVIILGKLPPPYMGPSIATEIILNSDLKNRFDLIHLDTKVNRELSSFGKLSLKKVLQNFVLYRKLHKLIKKNQPDLILVPISQTKTGFIKDSFFISIAAKHKIKTLVHLRGSEFLTWYESCSPSMKRRVIKTLAKCKGAIVLGNNLKYIFAEFFQDNKIFVVPNGGNYSFPLKQKNEKLKILFFSNLLVNKGVSDVLKAMDILFNQMNIKNIECDLVGAWHKEEDKVTCESILKNNSFPVKIHQPCAGEEKFRFFSDADIFVFPPRESEGHPWSIVEAMAAGLPVISTDKGAIIESVINDRNGYIIQPGSPKELADKIKLLMDDNDLRTQMGKESKKIYLAKFTEEQMVDNLSSVFNSVIS